MSDTGEMTAAKPQRTRKRNTVKEEDRQKIAERIVKFYNDENTNRSRGRAARLQRYAKYRMWSQGTDWPWPDASDAAWPDMFQDSSRVQDTLHNAVMSQSPPVVSKATKDIDEKKQKNIDNLLQFQMFVENEGEKFIGELAEAFANESSVTVYVPWVRERKKVCDVRVFDAIPEDADPKGFFQTILKDNYPDARVFEPSGAGWDWTVTLPSNDDLEVSFYTNEAKEIEMLVERFAIVFDAPCPMVKDYDDVLYPARVKNLQPPGPSNSGGSPYVILRDTPIVSEISGLKKSGYYDLLTDDDMTKLEKSSASPTGESESAKQKDDLAGTQEQPGQPQDASHKKLTRLICFRVNEDGDEVVEWVILETKTTLRVRRLSDISPGSPPKRPLFGGSFLEVGGRYDGISLLETMEPLHDAVKVIVDQGINANDLAIASPGYYRPSGGMNPEVLRIEPYSLNPLQNPQQDIIFPPMGNPQAMGFSLNMINMLGMEQDKVTMVTDSSFGQVTPGSSSALRTIGNMSLLQGQGEARPERILRRFFMIVTAVWGHMHRLNRAYLPEKKQFRIVGFVPEGQNPYVKIQSRDDYDCEFDFAFNANAFNTSKNALQQSLMTVAKLIINPLTVQLGVTNGDKIYNLLSDIVASFGQPANRYTSPPKPEDAAPNILAEEAITEIMRNQLPIGVPAEPGGAAEHIEKLNEFMASNEFGLLQDHQVDLFKQYMLQVHDKATAQAQQAQLLQSAGQFAQTANQQGPGAPPQAPPQAPPGQPAPVSGPAELQNEQLPGAGGGANANGA